MSKRILESIRAQSHDFTQFSIFHVSSFLAQFTAVRRNIMLFHEDHMFLFQNITFQISTWGIFSVLEGKKQALWGDGESSLRAR